MTTKLKYIITIKKNLDLGGAQAPLGPHLGPSQVFRVFEFSQNFRSKFQILKLHGVKSNHPQILGCNLQFTLICMMMQFNCSCIKAVPKLR